MRVLLAEDDQRLGKLIAHMLDKEKIQVDWVQQGDAAYEYASHEPYEVIILDWMMPCQSGIEVCNRLRKEGYQGSILLLTAKDAVDDKVMGLEMGADDYLVKPFEFAELLARVRALGRRGGIQFREEIVTIGDLVMNRSMKTVQRDGRDIQLTGREFQLLDFLVQNRGQVLPKEIILDRVWGLEAEVSSNNLEAYIRLLRKKIDLPEERMLIHNVRGVGYKLEV
jgi:DNA-binding response OmpR family regulator